MTSETLQQAFIQAQARHQAGQFRQAARLYRQVLGQAGGEDDVFRARVHGLLGLACSQLGEHADALAHLEQALELAPGSAGDYSNFGEALRRAGQLERAEAAFRQALALQPAFAEAHFGLGNLCKAQERLEEAAQHYRLAVQHDPRHLGAWYNLGNTFLAMGRFASAAECYRATVSLAPGHAQAYNNLGAAQMELDKLPQAIESYRRAAELRPDYPEAQRNLAQALEKRGDLDDARQAYRRLVALQPGEAAFRLHVETLCPIIMPSCGAIDEYHARVKDALERFRGTQFTPQQLSDAGLAPASLTIYHGLNELPVKRGWAEFLAASLAGSTRAIAQDGRRAAGQGRIPRLGFVVTHGHEGVFLKCMRGMVDRLAGMDVVPPGSEEAPAFHVTLVCSRQAGVEILRPGIANPRVDFLPLPADLERAAGQIRAAQFDILYYWEVGTDALNYYLPYYRLAPVQCASWGWPTTSGIPNLDYFISCELLESDDAQKFYSERLVQLERLPTCYYRPLAPGPSPQAGRGEVRARFGLGAHDHLYLCTQNLRKVHPDFDRLAGDILRDDPRGRLLFIHDAQPGVTDLLRRRLQETMEETFPRVQFLPRLPEAEYLQVVSLADVVLDTVHYCGGANTTYDALAAGVPIVTLPMRYHRGRYTAAAYRQMGFGDLIARSAREYVWLALRLANEADFRARACAEIRQRSAALFEDQQAVDELAAFFRQALERALDSQGSNL
jgi:protein O-GlcNAc transferase